MKTHNPILCSSIPTFFVLKLTSVSLFFILKQVSSNKDASEGVTEVEATKKTRPKNREQKDATKKARPEMHATRKGSDQYSYI